MSRLQIHIEISDSASDNWFSLWFFVPTVIWLQFWMRLRFRHKWNSAFSKLRIFYSFSLKISNEPPFTDVRSRWLIQVFNRLNNSELWHHILHRFKNVILLLVHIELIHQRFIVNHVGIVDIINRVDLKKGAIMLAMNKRRNTICS